MTIYELISQETGFPSWQMTGNTKLDDLGIDSLEFVVLMQAISTEFGEIPKEKWISFHTIDDIVAAIPNVAIQMRTVE